MVLVPVTELDAVLIGIKSDNGLFTIHQLCESSIVKLAIVQTHYPLAYYCMYDPPNMAHMTAILSMFFVLTSDVLLLMSP